MDSIEVQWAWGKAQAERFEAIIKRNPDQWLVCMVMPEEYTKLWQEFGYPFKYYLDLEDNVDTKIENFRGTKGLYGKYSPPPSRRGRLKKFFSGASQSK